MAKFYTCRREIEVDRFEKKLCLEPTVDGEFCALHVSGAQLDANWKGSEYVGPVVWP